jgi:hypothetical protein
MCLGGKPLCAPCNCMEAALPRWLPADVERQVVRGVITTSSYAPHDRLRCCVAPIPGDWEVSCYLRDGHAILETRAGVRAKVMSRLQPDIMRSGWCRETLVHSYEHGNEALIGRRYLLEAIRRQPTRARCIAHRHQGC